MTNHPIVTEIPSVKAALDEEAKVEAAEKAHDERVESILAPHHVALADWDRERRAALLSGREVPERPAEPDVGDVAGAKHLFTQERTRLRRQIRQAIADAAPEIEQRFADWEADRVKQARPHVIEVQRFTAEWNEALQALREVRAITDAADPNSRPASGTGLVDRTRQAVNAHDVVDAVAGGDSLLALEPIVWRGEVVPEETGYRFSKARPFGEPPDMRPKPKTGAAYI